MRTDRQATRTRRQAANDANTCWPTESPVRPLAGQGTRSAELSIISASVKVIGDLECDAEIFIDGRVAGDVRGRTVTIGPNGAIAGSVYAESVTVGGGIDGRIEARSVTLGKTARITGDIVHETLRIEAGARIDGRCRPEFTDRDAGNASAQPAIEAVRREASALDDLAGPAVAAVGPGVTR